MKRLIHYRLLLFTTLILVYLPTVITAAQVNTSLNYDPPNISKTDNFHQVELPKALNIGKPGTPSLPSAAVWLLLPPGERAVSVELKAEVWRTIKGKYTPSPIQTPKPISDISPYELTPPDPAIYEDKNIFPAHPVSNLNTHLKRGYALASCLISPIRWNPVDGSLEYLAEAELTIETTPGQREQSGYERFFRDDAETRESVMERVRNDEQIGCYPRRDSFGMESILILTVSEFLSNAELYADWWRLRGMRTFIVIASDLIRNNNGRDDPEKIRNGIINAYQNFDIGYVIIIGDDENVPHRGLHCMGENDMPADLYYGTLDGNWNDDGDERWGEIEEADLLAEVIVGRLCCDQRVEVEITTNKVIRYSEAPVVDNIESALMVGEYLGGDTYDAIYMDQIYNGSNAHGHNTVGFPDRFNRQNLYDRDREWDAYRDLAPLISQGYHLVNHGGHSGIHYNMKFSSGDLTEDVLTNYGEENGYNIGYTQGCYAGSFDNRLVDPNRYALADCISERFTSGLETAFVAFISNSRYGWYRPGGTDGPSQHFHREFVDAIFGEGITRIGCAQQDSKEDLAGWHDGHVMTWCYYNLNLFGDPLMDIWTEEPRELEPEHVGVVHRRNDQFDVTIDGVEGALVSLMHQGREIELIASVLSGGNGIARLEWDEPVQDVDSLRLSIIAHNCYPYSEILPVVQSEGGYPWVTELIVEDEIGNDNGIADAGETIILNLRLRNLGLENLERVTVTFEIEDSLVTPSDDEAEYPFIEVDDELISEHGIEITISSFCKDHYDIAVMVHIEDGVGERWSQHVSFEVHAPEIGGWTINILDENDNNNGRIDPGEEVDMRLNLTNVGSGDANNVVARLICDNDLIELIDTEVRLPVMEAEQLNTIEETFRIRISNDCLNPDRVVFYIRLNGDLGFYHTLLRDYDIGGLSFNFDDGEEDWEHYSIGDDGWGDQWCISNSFNHTPGGSASLKLGPDRLDGYYDDSLNCAIEIPEYQVTAPTEMVFWHKMSVECYYEIPTLAFDGGFLEISVDDDDWELLSPETDDSLAYPYVINEGPRESPIDGMPCYSGEHHWNQAVFDLTGFVGESVRIRFHFASDRSIGKRGWMIDDIRFRLPRAIEVPLELEGEIDGQGAYLTWTTPLPRRDDPVADELIGYRIYRGDDNLDTLVTDIRYFDNLTGMPRGDYYYMVSAEYLNGVSNPSNEIELYWNANDVSLLNDDIPTEWTLSGSHPNPFNNRAMISYSVPRQGFIQLDMYNLSGRLITKLTEGIHQPGNYRVQFDAGHLPSGIYIIHYGTPSGSKSSRIVLLR
ncbi:MAG: C25 family cysteine peptidase [Candidatus Hatepunaea meridiana]|nr:C25 family cysteine peptidase [Candidatus Hatepunaea meridiana]